MSDIKHIGTIAETIAPDDWLKLQSDNAGLGQKKRIQAKHLAVVFAHPDVKPAAAQFGVGACYAIDDAGEVTHFFSDGADWHALATTAVGG